jgi:hypothetical protein
MNNINLDILNDVVLDYENPHKIYKLAREYDIREQGAAAFGWYLRAADMSTGKTWDDKWIQYKSMIMGAFIYDRSRDRNHSTEGLLKIAIETMPERPEAFYFLAKHKASNDDWRESLMYSAIGLRNAETDVVEDKDIGYPGINGLRLLYARAKWKTDGRDDSKNLAFDLKYKNKISKDIDNEVTELLKQHGYPSTLPYDSSLESRYKYKFNGLADIQQNYSRHFQDMFVLSVLNGKRNGTFIELGSGHPTFFNNTKLLEEEFGWKGISLDNSERMCSIFSRERSTNVIFADAAETDYNVLFKQNVQEQTIDFLRINAEGASIPALEKIPFDKHMFNVIQFQHNACWWGDGVKDQSRKILQDLGYVCLVANVAVSETLAYEDWWVHPQVAKANRVMKAKDGINFAWDYMMEKVV